MENFIIIAVVAVVVALAVRASVKHFRGEGGCCGGGAYKARPRRLSHVADTKTFRVEGMHCQNCVNRVMEAVNAVRLQAPVSIGQVVLADVCGLGADVIVTKNVPRA